MYSSVPTTEFTFTFRAHVPSSAFTFSFPLRTVMQSTAIFMDDPMDIDADMMDVDNPLEMEASIIQEDPMDIDPPVLNASVRAVGIGPHAMWSSIWWLIVDYDDTCGACGACGACDDDDDGDDGDNMVVL
ncbi:hypothetical protein G6F56_012232 [Rhizopus delemar]|nr:hypothetical protein G6F56_012232 [Rhizopus delemar]